MPLYEFQCRTCGLVTEKMMKISEPAPEECSCGAKGCLEKIISKTSFVLKGSGWYETDFKGNGSKKAPASSSSSSSTVDSSPSVSETKPHSCSGDGCH